MTKSDFIKLKKSPNITPNKQTKVKDAVCAQYPFIESCKTKEK